MLVEKIIRTKVFPSRAGCFLAHAAPRSAGRRSSDARISLTCRSLNRTNRPTREWGRLGSCRQSVGLDQPVRRHRSSEENFGRSRSKSLSAVSVAFRCARFMKRITPDKFSCHANHHDRVACKMSTFCTWIETPGLTNCKSVVLRVASGVEPIQQCSRTDVREVKPFKIDDSVVGGE